MLESSTDRLCRKGGAHFGSPDKEPAARLMVIRDAGAAAIPFTSGILIGIGETRRERLEALLHLRDLHDTYKHLQEVIIQNFRAKPGTRMEDHPEPAVDELLWTIAAARLLFGPDMNVQAPPNLSPTVLRRLIAAGINDWGGVSPITPDYVNPEQPWPQLDVLARETAKAGKVLTERLTIYPSYVQHADMWLDPALRTFVSRAADTQGFARADGWVPGSLKKPKVELPTRPIFSSLDSTIAAAMAGRALTENEIVGLFKSRGDAFHVVCQAADAPREDARGATISYVVTRNINYTNICYFRCKFCAFSKGKLSENLRGRPYELSLDEIQRRAKEAWDRGAVEVCLQGGIHPSYDGSTYLSICRAIKEVCPRMHVHAFSPLEIWQGASILGIPIESFLSKLKEAGLGSLPGTAAEILDDTVRAVICPDKLTTAEWLDTIAAAHQVGLRTTATIMFGHVDGPAHWARHLAALRALQQRTGGFTELVPLPFVHMEAPLYHKGAARRGPTFREAVLMHAVARLALHPVIAHIQVSWVKMGRDGARACLQAGCDDLGGTLMNESISRAAGAAHGQELPPFEMEALIASIGRRAAQRTTLYAPAPAERQWASRGAAALTPVVQTPVKRRMPVRTAAVP
jgi:FO synthase